MTSKKPYERPSYPTRLTVDIHSHCNASCVMCPYPEIARSLPMGKMPWDLYHGIINDFGAICERQGFRGRLGYCVVGEPFLEKNILKYIRLALEHHLRINITTNASLMSPAVVDALVDAGFDGTFRLSCHGITPATIKRIMGLDVDQMLANIDYLVEHYPKDKIEVVAIHIDWPADERRKMRQHWKSRGVEVHSPLPGSRAGLVGKYDTKPITKLVGCKSKRPLYHMTVAFNGDVPLCCNDMARRMIVGNLRDQTIEEVWNSERFLAVVDQVYGVAPSPQDFLCNKCEWAMTSSSSLGRLRRELRRTAAKIGSWVGERNRT